MADEKTGTCGCGTGCCSEPAAEEAAKRQVVIDFLFLDLEVCTWCKGTGDSLGGALAQVADRVTGVDVSPGMLTAMPTLTVRLTLSPPIRTRSPTIRISRLASSVASATVSDRAGTTT